MLLFSVIIICIAHYIRTLRWELLIETYEKPDEGCLMNALSIGYFINYFIPFKAGDLVRSYIVGRKMKNGFAFSLATVIVDRALDIIIVGFIFLLFTCLGFGYNKSTMQFYLFLSVGIVCFAMLAWYCRKYVKKMIKKAASIFNERLEFAILKFFWSLIWIFQDMLRKISKVKLFLSTVLMWGLYLLAYGCFARFLSIGSADIKMIDIFYMLFAKDSMHIGSLGVISHFNVPITPMQILDYLLFLLLPTIFLFILSFLIRRTENAEEDDMQYINLIPHLDYNERLNFLETYFSSEQSLYIDGYLRINRDILIIRDYSAGSNASTMLCMDGSRQFFRKYAFNEDGDKLFQQIEWLQKFQGLVPLPDTYIMISRTIIAFMICRTRAILWGCLSMRTLCHGKMHGRLSERHLNVWKARSMVSVEGLQIKIRFWNI